MAKNKKSSSAQQVLSPEKYIRTKARNLPIAECLIGDNWQETGLTTIIIARRHTNGNYTIGSYLVDTFCLGVKLATYFFNISSNDYEEYKEHLSEHRSMHATSYNEAHNLIFGSIAYAEELGINPCKEFELTQYILEEDTDDIPLIEYEFGKDGKPCLVVENALEGSKYLPTLEITTGGEFRYFIQDEELVSEEEAAYMEENWNTVEYAYAYPEYPKELHLTHPELMVLLDKNKDFFLEKEFVESLLSLPRHTLIADLEQIIRYKIGETNELLEKDTVEKEYDNALPHALNLLAELKAEESLDVILEVMRQKDEFMDYTFGDMGNILFPHILFYTAVNQPDKIKQYLMEPGLGTYLRYYTLSGMIVALNEQPDKREEVINWCRDVLNLFLKQADNKAIFDSGLIGMTMADLIAIEAVELLPEIEKLFQTNKVDTYCAGDYEQVKKRIKEPNKYKANSNITDIHTWYENFRKIFNVN